MKRWKKHIWTGSLLTVSVMLIVAAVLMGAVRLVDLAAPKYREDIARSLSESLQLRVTIGGMGMNWQAFRPSFELDEVIILDEDRRPVFQVGHVELPFKWTSLFSGELYPYLVELNGLAISLEWRADGSVGVRGVKSDGPGELDLSEVMGYLDNIHEIHLVDGVVNWKDFGTQIGLSRVEQVNASVRRNDDGLALQLSGRLPRHLGEQFSLQASLQGDLTKPDELEIETRFQTDTLFADGWLAPILRDTAALRGGPIQVNFHSQWKGLNFGQATFGISANPLKDVGAEVPLDLPGLDAELKITPLGGGWEMDIISLQYWYETGKGPVSQGHFRYQPTPDGFGTRLDAELDQIQAADVLSWLSVLSLTEGHVLPFGPEVKGQLNGTYFKYQQALGAEPSFTLTSQVEALSLPPAGAIPGLKGFAGKVHATETAGRIEFSSQQGELSVPTVFSSPMPLDDFTSEVHWEKQDKGWRLFSESLSLNMLSVRAKGNFELLLDDQPSPYINLQLGFSASDIVPLKPFIPLPPALPASVGQWLSASLLGGEVPKGDFVLRGRLADFPYADNADKGLFRISFDTRNAGLEYAEGWPTVTKVVGRAIFEGRSMFIAASYGETVDTPVESAVAEIPDFLNPILKIRGTVKSDAGKQLSFLEVSPLREDYAGLTDAISLSGPAHLELALDIPLDDVEATTVSGDIELLGANLKYSGLDQPVTEIRGLAHFSADGLASDNLQGKFLGLPARAVLTPIQSEAGQRMALNAALDISLPEHAPMLADFIEPGQLAAFKGRTTLRLSSEFDITASASAFTLTSDLAGMQIDLGKPFGKTAEALAQLKVELMPAGRNLDVNWHFRDQLRGVLRFRDSGQGYGFHSGRLNLGASADLSLPVQPRLYIQGKMDVLDLTGIPLPASSEGNTTLPPVSIDAEVKDFRIAHQRFEDLMLKTGGPETDSIGLDQGVVHIQSKQALGKLEWSGMLNGRIGLKADFDRLHLQPPPEGEKEETKGEAQETQTPLDPADFPVLTLVARKFRMGGEGLGTLKLDTQAIDTGLRISLLEIGGRKIEVRGGGEWVRDAGKSSARLVMNINGKDLIGLLNATGYAPSITAEQADIFLELDWAPSEAGLELQNLNGKMSFDLVDGSLLEVQPGAGRVLSLLSFYSLPRRLTLDISDVLGKGTAFDKLTGDFAIVDGNATTEDLLVTMPSARIEVRGRIGLAAQDYDQRVTIYPGVTSGVALTGALLSGPVLGIGLWIAQELLDEPLDKVAQLSYHLTGSWDEPEVKPLEVKANSQPSPAPAANSQKRPRKRPQAAPEVAPEAEPQGLQPQEQAEDPGVTEGEDATPE